MNTGKTIFSQIMEFLPLYEFYKCIQRYHGDYKVQSFSCMDQFLCMAFAQLTYRESLRDIESCLRFMQPKLYHMGFRGQVSRNTLANANNQRDWHIYADLAQVLIHRARKLYLNEPFGVELEQTVYALDATTKAAIKLHTLLDLRGNIPAFIEITDGKADISTSRAFMFYIRTWRFLSPEPNPIFNTKDFIRVRSTNQPACVAIKQFF